MNKHLGFSAKQIKTEEKMTTENNKIMKTLYKLTKQDCIKLTELYNTEQLALILWNKNKASSLERGIFKAKKIRKFANSLV